LAVIHFLDIFSEILPSFKGIKLTHLVKGIINIIREGACMWRDNAK
jgi:hypothetical protein